MKKKSYSIIDKIIAQHIIAQPKKRESNDSKEIRLRIFPSRKSVLLSRKITKRMEEKYTFIYAKSFFSSNSISLTLVLSWIEILFLYKRRIGSHQIFIRKHTAKIYKVKIHSTVKSSFENIKKVYARV